MVAGFLPDRLGRVLRAVLHPIGEFIHVSAIYLGLAVLTTLGLSLVLPSMRQQSQQLHEVVLAMFQADGAAYGGSDADYAWMPPADQTRGAAAEPGEAAGSQAPAADG